jgi:signal transduction histidine kinase
VDLAALAREVIAETIAQSFAAADRRRAVGRRRGTGDVAPAVIRGDAVSLRTLLANLVDNALRYTP